MKETELSEEHIPARTREIDWNEMAQRIDRLTREFEWIVSADKMVDQDILSLTESPLPDSGN